MRWEEMRGDSRTGYCEHCQLHVQNLSAMSRHRVRDVVARGASEHVCVTYTRRADGTLVTRCDAILDFLFGPIRRGFAWLLAASIPIVLSACQTQSQLTGRVGPGCNTPQQKKTASTEQERVIVTGGI